MAKPSLAPGEVEYRQGNGGDGSDMDPAERTPVAIAEFKNSQRQQDQHCAEDKKYGNSSTDHGQRTTDHGRLRAIFPTKPKEIEREEGNEPAVAVLLVEAPLVAEITTTNEEESAQSQGDEGDQQLFRRPIVSDRLQIRLVYQWLRVQAAIIRQIESSENRISFMMETCGLNYDNLK